MQGDAPPPRPCGLVTFLIWIQACGPLLVHSSSDGHVAAWDIRAPSDCWRIEVPSSRGLPRFLALDGAVSDLTWVGVGSSRGHVGLWDARFLREVVSFRHPTTPWIESMALARGSTGGSTPRAFIASGHHEVGLWDLAAAQIVQVVKIVGPEEPESALHEAPAALGGIAQAIRVRRHRCVALAVLFREFFFPPMQGPGGIGPAGQTSAAMPGRSTSVRALVSLRSDHVVTGGNDTAIRLWDLSQPSNSRVVAGSSFGCEDPGKALSQRFTSRMCQGVPVVEELVRHREDSVPGVDPSFPQPPSNVAHADRVTALAWLEAGGILVSASRDGVVKLWK